MGGSNDPGRIFYSALNLRIDFGTEAFFIFISEPFGLQVEKRWSKCLRRTRSPRWTNLARSVRGGSDQVMEPVFEPRIYFEKVNPLPSSCSRTSELGEVQPQKVGTWTRPWELAPALVQTGSLLPLRTLQLERLPRSLSSRGESCLNRD